MLRRGRRRHCRRLGWSLRAFRLRARCPDCCRTTPYHQRLFISRRGRRRFCHTSRRELRRPQCPRLLHLRHQHRLGRCRCHTFDRLVLRPRGRRGRCRRLGWNIRAFRRRARCPDCCRTTPHREKLFQTKQPRRRFRFTNWHWRKLRRCRCPRLPRLRHRHRLGRCRCHNFDRLILPRRTRCPGRSRATPHHQRLFHIRPCRHRVSLACRPFRRGARRLGHCRTTPHHKRLPHPKPCRRRQNHRRFRFTKRRKLRRRSCHRRRLACRPFRRRARRLDHCRPTPHHKRPSYPKPRRRRQNHRRFKLNRRRRPGRLPPLRLQLQQIRNRKPLAHSLTPIIRRLRDRARGHQPRHGLLLEASQHFAVGGKINHHIEQARFHNEQPAAPRQSP